MDERLVKAARDGDVNTLHVLIEVDPEILERASLDHFADSALHVAALYGKADFVEQIVSRMPSLATEANQQGMIPLHLASLKGHIEAVRELLKAKLDGDGGLNHHQCLVKDDEGWTPLHCASQKGKIRVMEELIRECPQSLDQVTAEGDTVVHTALKANQFGAVKLLAESIKSHNVCEVFKAAQDQKGKTAYQLAAAKEQPQVLEFLKGDDEKSDGTREEDDDDDDSDEWQPEDAVLVVATLIVTLTYQAMANPPTAFLKDGSTRIDWSCLGKGSSQGLIKLLRDCPALLALLFMIFDSLIFFHSIFVLVSTLRGPSASPLKVLALNLVSCYCVLLMAFYYNAVYFALPYAGLAFGLSSYLHYGSDVHEWEASFVAPVVHMSTAPARLCKSMKALLEEGFPTQGLYKI